MANEFEIPAPVYRVRRRRGLDAGTRMLMLIAAGLGGSLLLVLGLSLVGGHHGGAVPVIEADSAPVRVKPEHPGGLAIAGQDDEVLTSAGDPSDKLAPAAEAPALLALRAQEREEAARAAVGVKPQVAAPAPPPAVVPLAAAAEPPAATPVATLPEHAASPVAAAVPAVPAGGRATEVQLGALISEAAAKQEWARLTHKAPELLSARQPAVSRLERGGQTMWRLRTGGFADTAAATAFCQRARAKGLACSIAAF